MTGPHAFPASERLTRKADYARVFKRGARYAGRHFICYLAPREVPGAQLGFAVSRKVGKAVVRNRVKRYLREFYRLHRPEFEKDVDLVVVARPAAASLSYQECAEALGHLLRRGGVLHG